MGNYKKILEKENSDQNKKKQSGFCSQLKLGQKIYKSENILIGQC